MRKLLGFAIILAAVLLAAPPAASAQSAVIAGSLGNFDIVNNTGHEAHGFEIELEGLQMQDVPYSFSVQRYGAAEIVPSPTGVYVRWKSGYDAGTGQFVATTIVRPAGTAFVQGSCYMWNPQTYDSAGCEHFGVSLTRNAIATTYRWLVEDPANPGTLVPVTLASPVAAPVYAIVPPARPGNAPALVAEVPAPEPAESPERYGPAQWMKTFKTQLRREVGLDELLGDNPMIPQDRGQIEVEWELVQDTPNVEGKQKRNGALRQGTLDGDTRAVVRRFEIYDYTGAYDPVTNQALCADLTCTAPSAGELGDFVSAQMTAANVRVPSLTVTKVGSGDVSSSDRSISCGSKCSAFESDGALIVLTASANSGSAFRRWTGACDGPDPICRVGINEHADVAATFAQIFNLSVSKSKSGSVSADQAGVEQTLNCGGTCSVKYAAGSVVTLTAVPAPGKQFVNWSGGPCDKSAVAVCTVLITRDTSIQPNFTK